MTDHGYVSLAKMLMGLALCQLKLDSPLGLLLRYLLHDAAPIYL